MAQSTQSGKQVGDKLKSHGPENRGASGGQVGNKSQLHGPGRPDRVATQSVAGDKWGQKWGNKWGDKWQQVGDKLTPHGPKHPEWEASARQVKITWPKAPRVGRQVKVKVTWPRAPKQVGDKWETSLVSHGPRKSNIYIYVISTDCKNYILYLQLRL